MSNTVLTSFKDKYDARQTEVMSMETYLKRIKKEPKLYASPAERLLAAIGEPILIDTSKDERLGRIHANKVIRTYKPFASLYGIENALDQVVSFLRCNAQNLEESNQILYLVGPVGSAKSTIAATLKHLMEQEPIYVLEGAPMQESPLDFFSPADAKELGIPQHYLMNRTTSPWALKRLEEFNGDLAKFNVVKVYPSELRQIGIGVVLPADEQTQDVSTIVGKINIRELEHFPATDPDAYSYSGGLCHGNQGIMEFVEMFKADHKILHPLLGATQEHTFKGTEALSSLPFNGIIIAHSNESEWEQFRKRNTNEALLDRVCLIKIPYCLRINEEVEIYKKLLRDSELANAPIAPGTLELLATFAVISRLETSPTSAVTKAHVYNGELYTSKDKEARNIFEYKEEASSREGFFGISTRAAKKILSKVFNFDLEERAANPVHLMEVLSQHYEELIPDPDVRTKLATYLEGELTQQYYKDFSRDLQTAQFDSYSDFGQNVFDNYITHADSWLQNKSYRDPETGQLLDLRALDEKCNQLESAIDVSNPKDFRNEMVTFCLRYRNSHDGQNPPWTVHAQIKNVIEEVMFAQTDNLLPFMAFSPNATKEHAERETRFLNKMLSLGYTAKQIKLLIQWQANQSVAASE